MEPARTRSLGALGMEIGIGIDFAAFSTCSSSQSSSVGVRTYGAA
jgi:hypothetical protein